MKLAPDSGTFPRLQPRPRCFATAAHLLWHILPTTTRYQHEPNDFQHGLMSLRRPTPIGARLLFQGQHRTSQLVVFLRHACVRHDSSPCERDKSLSWLGANPVPKSLAFHLGFLAASHSPEPNVPIRSGCNRGVLYGAGRGCK